MLNNQVLVPSGRSVFRRALPPASVRSPDAVAATAGPTAAWPSPLLTAPPSAAALEPAPGPPGPSEAEEVPGDTDVVEWLHGEVLARPPPAGRLRGSMTP